MWQQTAVPGEGAVKRDMNEEGEGHAMRTEGFYSDFLPCPAPPAAQPPAADPETFRTFIPCFYRSARWEPWDILPLRTTSMAHAVVVTAGAHHLLLELASPPMLLALLHQEVR